MPYVPLFPGIRSFEYVFHPVKSSDRKNSLCNNQLVIPFPFPYTERMKNNERTIDGAIQTGVSLRVGTHGYEDNQEVVELTFQGYNCSYVQVIDLDTAWELHRKLGQML